MANKKIDSNDMKGIFWSTMFTVIMTLLIFAPEILSKTGTLFDLTSGWTSWAMVPFLLSLICVLFFAYKQSDEKPLNKSWLYLLCILYLSLVFFCVNASGGLTLSPFISFYATILAVGIIISEKPANKFFSIRIRKKIDWTSNAPRSLVLLVIFIALCMFGHLCLQYKNHTGQLMQDINSSSNKSEVDSAPDPNQEEAPPSTASQDGKQMPFMYLFKYMLVILIALIATGVADYKSLNSTASDATISSTPTPRDDKEKTT